MGKAEYFESFKQNADEFICSILPGISHPQVQYSPGIYILSINEKKQKLISLKSQKCLESDIFKSLVIFKLVLIFYFYFYLGKGGLIFKAGGSNMQHVTSLSFLLLAYSNYLSHAKRIVPCGETSASPALLKHLAQRQVKSLSLRWITGPFSNIWTKLTARFFSSLS